MTLLARGLLIGFLVAIPIGPMGVLCVRRMLVKGRLAGLVSGMGMAALVSLLQTRLTPQTLRWINQTVGILLAVFGVVTLLARPL